MKWVLRGITLTGNSTGWGWKSIGAWWHMHWRLGGGGSGSVQITIDDRYNNSPLEGREIGTAAGPVGAAGDPGGSVSKHASRWL